MWVYSSHLHGASIMIVHRWAKTWIPTTHARETGVVTATAQLAASRHIVPETAVHTHTDRHEWSPP